MVKKVTGVNFRVREMERRPGDPPALSADNSLAKVLLGWAPRYDDLELIIRSAWEWEQSLLKRRAV